MGAIEDGVEDSADCVSHGLRIIDGRERGDHAPEVEQQMDEIPARLVVALYLSPELGDVRRSGGHASGWWRDGLHGACVQRRAAGWRPVRREHACDERSGMRGAGGYEPSPSLAPELLTHPLIGRPCAPARSGSLE
jgi:hypothetical protein